MNTPGSYRAHPDHEGCYECSECEEPISPGEEAITAEYVEVEQRDDGVPDLHTKNYVGIYHVSCFEED